MNISDLLRNPPPQAVITKAQEDCFDDAFESGEWIQRMSDLDKNDFLLRLWIISHAVRDDSGDLYTSETRDIDLRATMDKEAYHYCDQIAEADWPMFVPGGNDE